MSIIPSHIQPLLDKRIPAALVAALCASPAFAQTGSASPPPARACTLERLASLDMKVSDGQVTVPIGIGGINRNFLLALSNADAAVTQSLSDELKLESRPLPSHVEMSIDHQHVSGITTLPDIQIGVVEGKNVSMLLVPELSADNSIVGSIGTNLLRNFDAELDFKSAKLNLFQPSECQGNVVYWANSYAAVPFKFDKIGLMHFKMRLDGKDVDVALDTTRAHAVMSMMAARTIFGLRADSPELKPDQSFVEGFQSYSYPFKSLSVDGVSINDPAIEIYDDPSTMRCNGVSQGAITCYGGADLIIGLSELRALHIYISFKDQMLYVTAAGATK